MKIGEWQIKRVDVIYVAVIILLILSAIIFKSGLDSRDISRVSYRNRVYLNNNEQIDESKSSPELLKLFKQTKPTEVTTKGMEVYDIDKDSKYVSTCFC